MMRAALVGLKWLAVALVAIVAGLFLFALIRFGPVPLTLAWAKDAPNGFDAAPPIAQPFDANAARAALEGEVYGPWPDLDGAVRVLSTQRGDYLGAELLNIELAVETGDIAATYGVSLVRRDPTDPLIVWSSFSPRGAAIDHPLVPGSPMTGRAMGVVEFVFGRYIQSPPVADILEAGYGFAVLHPPELVPDNGELGETALRALFGGDDERPGAVMAWAWEAALALDMLEILGEAQGPVIAGGHSRYGKSALVWAAWDTRVDGVISHQSGTGGASLSRGKRGETVEQIADSYPHWFARSYSEESLTVDQHHLLALIAPRPVLLGNARRDVWSDPNGALRAARGAAEVYGMDAPESLVPFAPEERLSLWIRPGTHGIVEEDWPAFLEWMGVWFGEERAN